MRRVLAAGAAALAAALLVATAAPAAAQLATLPLPGGDSISAAPFLAAHTVGVVDSMRPVRLQLDIANTPDFAGPLYTASRQGDTATFFLPRPLPEHSTVYFRLRGITASGRVFSEEVSTPRVVQTWLSLLSPNGYNNVSVATLRPTFYWHSSHATAPPGPWLYDLSVINAKTGVVEFFTQFQRDTAYTLPADVLQAQTSYRWNVVAHLANGLPTDTAFAQSNATFVILGTARTTLLYQNFPNPFPSPASAVTCFWFDLARSDLVHLDIYDLRGNPVKTIVPGPQQDASMAAGEYGRNLDQGQSGCDPRFQWDGTDAAGHVVPPGIYFVRLRANGVDQLKKIVFLGR
ncbi:MAG TPA: hypothetical protein VFT41_01975 [Gemmatimonadaceae bacterium]|nr:hypothetical protein [Gemmatimonadaceae bacterium]